MRLYTFFKFPALLFTVCLSIIDATASTVKAQQSPVKIEILREKDSQKNSLSIKEDVLFLPLQDIEKLLNKKQNVILASPNQFNPNLRILDPEPLPVEQFIVSPKQSPVMTDYAVLDSMTTNFQNDDDKSGQRNQIIEPTWKWRFQDGTVISFQTGFNSFNLANKQSIYNVPLQFGVEKKLGSVNLSVQGGIDIYDRLPTTANIEVNANVPLLNGVTLFGFFEQKPYKSNVNTLENQIKIRRFGPNIYWQIDPYTTLFSLYRWGDYTDGNTDQQSFSRLERKWGQFAIAGNLFTWFYERESQPNTYFSPRDFLVYTGEISWQGDIFDFINCRFAINAGEQRGAGSFSPAKSYQAKCTVKVSPNIEADLGYSYSNVRKPDTGVSSNSETISGQLRLKF
jgi:hypothetical protein